MSNIWSKVKKDKNINSCFAKLSMLRIPLILILMLQLISLTPSALALDKGDKNKGLEKEATNNVKSSIEPIVQLPGDTLVTKHSPNLNGARIEGSARVLLPESFSLNSNTVVTGNIYVPGTPTVNINGNVTYRGTLSGNGNPNPSNYSINLNSGVTLNHIITGSDPISISNTPTVALPQGNRDVVLNNQNQSPGDFSTIRNLTLNSNYGLLTVPPGTYGQFIANSSTGFILGIDNQSTIYNLQGLILNANSQIQVRGSVTLNVQNTISLSSNCKMGNSSSPISLALNIASGGLNINAASELYGVVKATLGTVNLNSNSKLVGLLVCDRASLNSNSLLRGLALDSTPPQVTISQPTDQQIINTATTIVTGTVQDDSVVSSVKVNGVNATITGNSYSATVPLTVGSNTLTVTATDILNNVGTATVTVTRNVSGNQAPTVNAGADQSITLPTNNVTLNGTVTDDGLPQGANLTITWTKVSSPPGGTVSFANANLAQTTATFNIAGTYVLKLEATDSILTASDTVIITVNPAPQQNQAPQVSAGANQTITLPSNASLAGTATDDGLPNPPAQLTIAWSKISGNGTVSFSSSNTLVTSASFSVAGTYVLRLSASDSQLTSTSDVTIIVNPAQPNNSAPQVNAGTDQSITLPNNVTLNGLVSDDGNPNPPNQLTISWSKVNGPGVVSFTNPNGAITQASFSLAGTYTLRLTASDSVLSSSDDVLIVVNAQPNQPPSVSAGADQSIVLPAVITLNATAQDDGLPSNSLTFTWSKISGPSNVTFENPNSLNTNVIFDSPGTYVLRITASDGQLTSFDEVQITLTIKPRIIIYSNADGFDPEELTTSAGDKMLMIRNRTNQEITYVFTQGSQSLSVTAPAGKNVFIDATLAVGTATITAQGHADWNCLITVIP